MSFIFVYLLSWIAEDFCGNEAIDSPLIHVKDVTAPDIYRIYTLPNGNKLVVGVMENVIYQGPRNDVFNMFLHITLDSMNQSYLTNFIG